MDNWAMEDSSPETETETETRRRVLGILAATQVLGGVGVATGITVGALSAQSLSGSDAVAGFAQPIAVLGAAVFAVPISALAARMGRGPSLAGAYALGALGAGLAALAVGLENWLALLSGLFLFGSGTTAILAARFAAADAARPETRARDLSLVVWAITIGSVAGPNIASPAQQAASWGGLPLDTGPFLLSALAFTVAAFGVLLGLGKTVRLPASRSAVVTRSGHRVLAWREIRGSGRARLALTVMVVGQAVMIGVMSMTPVHMGHHDTSLGAIGLAMSVHIAGMYALSPVVGLLADRYGRVAVLGLGSGLLLAAAGIVTGASGHDVVRLSIGLALLGVGWSCGLVAGSTLLTESVSPASRPFVQGMSDMAMNAGGAIGGFVAGWLMAAWGYSGLGLGTALVTVTLLVIVVIAGIRRPAR